MKTDRALASSLCALSLIAAATVIAAAGCSSTRADGEATEEAVGVVEQGLNSGFRLPFKCGLATTVTQGNNSGFSHTGESAYGFDFGVPLNTPLVAAKGGVVTFARNDVKPGNPCYSGGGTGCINTLNYVTVAHNDNTSTVYAHMNAVSVTVGQVVTQGQALGVSGGTGYSTGPHAHVQRQQKCPYFYCQSIPMSFDDVVGAGVPVAGQAVKSANNCAGADCGIGDGNYCGGNGVKGDTSTLFLCTSGTPAVKEKCTYGCKAMAPGIDDRCATASEAPPDAGADAAANDAGAAFDAEVSPHAPPPSELPGSTPATETLPEEPPAEASSCSLAHAGRETSPASWAVATLGLAAALLLRRRAAAAAQRA